METKREIHLLRLILSISSVIILIHTIAYSKQEFDFNYPNYSLSASPVLTLETEQLRIDLITIHNETNENIYVFMDNFMYYNDLTLSGKLDSIYPFTSQIILHKKGADLKKYDSCNFKYNYAEFPSYYKKLSGEYQSYSIYNQIDRISKIVDLDSKYALKMNLYYFKESDIEKIEETLGVKISGSQLQIDNSNVIYGFRISESEKILNCANTNLINLNPDKLKIVIDKYIHKVEDIIDVKLYEKAFE